MAGVVVVAGMVLVDRHRARKEARAQKLVYDNERYADLERATRERLTQSASSRSQSFDLLRDMDDEAADGSSIHFERKLESRNADGQKTKKSSKWWSLRSTSKRSKSASDKDSRGTG